jgi:hypothetical protein
MTIRDIKARIAHTSVGSTASKPITTPIGASTQPNEKSGFTRVSMMLTAPATIRTDASSQSGPCECDRISPPRARVSIALAGLIGADAVGRPSASFGDRPGNLVQVFWRPAGLLFWRAALE